MKRIFCALPAFAVLTLSAACGGGTSASSPPASSATTPAPASTSYNGAAALLASAGPLHAHLGGSGGNDVLCDTDTATATDTGGAVHLVVNFTGPANLQASILATDGRSQNLTYTVGSGETGHEFDFTGYRTADLQTLTISATADGQAGTCDVINNMS